jgi:hypothetical protein
MLVAGMKAPPGGASSLRGAVDGVATGEARRTQLLNAAPELRFLRSARISGRLDVAGRAKTAT